jgi:hypothetical protein
LDESTHDPVGKTGIAGGGPENPPPQGRRGKMAQHYDFTSGILTTLHLLKVLVVVRAF